MKKELVFLCGARDFHAMDWYKSAKSLMPETKIIILTDLIESEGYKKLITDNDIVCKLFILDSFLFKKQSGLGHIWRNFLKLLVFPVQVILIKRFSKNHPNAIFHAHSMYYLFMAWAAKIPYVGTPQGSDILLKPQKSKLYKHFTIKSLKGAKAITVDSQAMKDKVYTLCGVNAHIIQNGIDLDSIFSYQSKNQKKVRERILSIRGFTSLYRIDKLLAARNQSPVYSKLSITFIYPFSDNEYKFKSHGLLKKTDSDLGRLDRNSMYDVLSETKLVFSIPISDSSPRSVYESIFCGCVVAITYNPYYDILPACMKSRIILLDLNNSTWFDDAVSTSETILATKYKPTSEALELFDQKESFKKIQKLLFD